MDIFQKIILGDRVRISERFSLFILKERLSAANYSKKLVLSIEKLN